MYPSLILFNRGNRCRIKFMRFSGTIFFFNFDVAFCLLEAGGELHDVVAEGIDFIVFRMLPKK